MKNFIYKGGSFYCNHKDDGLNHTVKVEIMDDVTVKYDCKNGLLQNPMPQLYTTRPYIILICSCGAIENISEQFKIFSGIYIEPVY